MIRICLYFGALLLFFSACVPNRKYVYLQKNDLHTNQPKDTVVRSYPQEAYIYKIQPNDALYVRFASLTPEEYDFFKESTQSSAANLNFSVITELVDREGMIQFPVLGKVKVAGMTVFEAQESLQKVASDYLDSVVVKVRLVNFRFSVLGEVAAEGTYASYNNRVTILEAIGLAGGMGELADRSQIKIIRQNEGQTTVGYVNLLEEDVVNSPYYYVHQNDVLIVSPLKQRPFRRYATQNVSLFISSLSLLLLIFNLTK